MKILIFGNGVMANITKECIKNENIFVDMIDPTKDIFENKDFDVIIDFSNHKATEKLINFALEKKKNILIATTGHTKREIDLIEKAAEKIAILKISNTSLGIKVMKHLVKEATKMLEDFDIEIIEAHHNRKIDAPSGTAISLADEIKKVRNLEIVKNRENKREKNEIGIHSVRAGTICGEHTVIFAGDDELLKIEHTALSRKIFANGAIRMAKELMNLKKGLYYGE